MKLDDPGLYDSNWDWCRAHSRYHFDNNRRDQLGEWYSILGRFQGDWSKDLADLSHAHAPITWATRKFYGDHDRVSPMLAQEEYDLEQSGAPVDLQLTDMTDDVERYPTFWRMSEFFGLEESKRRVHYQLPGQMFNIHIDKLWERCPEEPGRVLRVTIMLQDWEPGQFYLYGTSVYDHWRAGDIHIFDWANVPHATANASRSPRPCLQITGLKTAKTLQILDQASTQPVYQI